VSCALTASSFAANLQVIRLWPGTPPGSQPADYQDSELQRGDSTRRIINVTQPTLTVYTPEKPNGTAMVICPGGGFRWLSIDSEGADVARFLNSLGVTAFVLRYRLMYTPPGPDEPREKLEEHRMTIRPLAAADGMQAIRLVRSRAAEWGIAPDRIGIIGFSAGGYVAAAAALQYDAESRPNFAAPIYPNAPADISPRSDAPPLFLMQADDDASVPPPENSVRLYEAWHRAKLPVELHMYAHGGHGFGMKKRGLPIDSWTDRLRDWLAAQGLLQAH